MEDFHSIVPLLNKNLNLSYFGLFDGHSGKEVGVYLMENFHKILSQEIINNNNINLMNFDNMKNVINNSFAKTNSEINQQNFKNETGSTATILIIYNDNNSPTKRSFICANVGDTKAFMVNKQEIKLMTKDHKCSDKSEVKRIKDSGGIVFRERVFGTLMLTRSFGDKEMKKYGVTYMPDIYYHHIKGDDLYIIIGSDGVWDVVEEGEIFKLCQENISSNELSKKIIKLAKDRETHDNISCIVIKLNEK
jgi:serine/threonine protein phosphatase PrpC